jgi:hypothetical protein
VRGVRQRRPSVNENRQSDTRSLAVSEGMEVSLELVLRFGLTEKERAQAEACATKSKNAGRMPAVQNGPKNENASRVARRSTERDNHTRIRIWYTRGKFA